jgi:ATP-binding cassette subfamily C (CFTR/MRP) protein 4
MLHRVDGYGKSPRGDLAIFGLQENYAYLLLLSGFAISLVIVAELMNTEFYSLCMRTSENLHNDMFWRVLRAPMHFFDIRPVGIILTRFSRDIGLVDTLIPTLFVELFVCKIILIL